MRKALAAVCGGAAVLVVAGVARDAGRGPTVAVLVAARPLAVGETPAPSSVRVARFPVNLAPSGSIDSPDRIAGRRLSAPLGVGEPVTEHRLSGTALLLGLPPGMVAMHVTVTDPAAVSLVQPGDHVDVIGASGTVAHDVLVLRTDDPMRSGSGPLLSAQGRGASSGSSSGIVIAAGHSTAEAIARIPLDPMGRPALTLVLREP